MVHPIWRRAVTASLASILPSIGLAPPGASGQTIPRPGPQPDDVAPSTPATAPAPRAERPAAPAPRAAERDIGFIDILHAWTETRPADSRDPEGGYELGLAQLGRLLSARVDLEVEEATVWETLRALRRELGLNMLAFRLDPRGVVDRPGIDGELEIDLVLKGVTGVAALEAILAFAGPNVTWQIHNGMVEVGPKAHLARDDARRTEIYETTDLALDPPDYRPQDGGESYNRRDSDENAGELVRMIVSHCEPDAFLAPPPPVVEDAGGRMQPSQHTTPAPPASGRGRPTGRSNPNTGATLNLDPRIAPVFVKGQWASIQVKDNSLVVLAPDFVHRAINGCPRVILPKAGE